MVSENAVATAPGLSRRLAGDLIQVSLPSDAGWGGLDRHVRDSKHVSPPEPTGVAPGGTCQRGGVLVLVGPSSGEQAEGVVFAGSPTPVEVVKRQGRLFHVLKRGGDLLLSSVMLCVLFLPMVVVACAVKLTSPGPVLFKATRIGRNGVPFTCLKFRTMATHAPVVPQLPDHRSYLTPIGGFLRRCSIDELPQLVNIIKGEMSLVGPRPVPADEVFTLLGRAQNGASELRPGLTGLAQVNGRDRNSEEQRLAYDGNYAKRLSLPLDMVIIARTFKWAFFGDTEMRDA